MMLRAEKVWGVSFLMLLRSRVFLQIFLVIVCGFFEGVGCVCDSGGSFFSSKAVFKVHSFGRCNE